MPAVSPLAATAPAPTSVGGAVSAEPGAFAQALARVEDSAKPVTKAAPPTHVAPAREVETETASTEASPPTTVAGANLPVTPLEAEPIAREESSTAASADDQGEAEAEALSQDIRAQDVTVAGVMALNVTAQDSTNQGATARGATPEGVTAQGPTARGATAESTTAQGAVAQGATAQGATPEGVTAQGAAAQGATAQGATTESTTAQGAIAQRATAQGATAESVTAQGAAAQGATAESVATQGVTTQGVTIQGVTAEGPTAEGFAAQGAPASGGIPQISQTVGSQTVALQSVAGTAETAAGSQDLAAPGLNAEQTATAEGGDEALPASEPADAASEAVQTAAAPAPLPAVAAATTAASSPALPLSDLPVRDPAAGPAPASRRAEGRTAEADGKSASAPRPNGLEGVGVQTRATTSVAATADGSAATLLSAQMAGQATGDGQPEQIDVFLGAAGSATDEAEPLTVAPAPTTVSSAPAGSAATVHGSQLAASTIETTAHLAAQIARRLEGRSTRFDMALTPDDLGRVDVSLDIDADGGLTARLAFDNPLAATELRGRADELRRQLQDAGFTVGADSLSFSERETGSSNGGSDQRFGRGAEYAFIGAGRLTDDLDTVAVPPAWISHSQTPQGVDLKV